MQTIKLTPEDKRLLGKVTGKEDVTVICDSTNAAFEVDLYDASMATGVNFYILNIGANVVTLNAPTGQYLNDVWFVTLEQWDCYSIIPFDGKWYIINKKTNRFGDETNYTRFASNGHLTFNGSATVFDDIQFPLVTARTSGTSDDPTWKLLENNGAGSTGIWAFSFSKSVKNQVWCGYEAPHCYKEYSTFKIHYHIYPENNNTGDIVFETEYGFNNIGTVLPPSVVAQYVYTVPANSAKKHLYIEVASVTRTDLKISHGIGLRVCRRGDLAADTYDGECWITRAAIHIEKDSFGSNTEHTK